MPREQRWEQREQWTDAALCGQYRLPAIIYTFDRRWLPRQTLLLAEYKRAMAHIG